MAEKKKEKTETDLKNRKQSKINCCVPFLFVTGLCRRGKERGRKSFQIHTFFRPFSRRRVGSRAASGGGAWEDAPPLFMLF